MTNAHSIDALAPTQAKKYQKLTLELFLDRAEITHGNRYDYSKVEIKNVTTKVEIICREHGSFFQLPNRHTKGSNCKQCVDQSKLSSQEDYLKNVNEVHAGAYSYEKARYTKSNEKLIVTCNKHGDFSITATGHLSGRGCNECAIEKSARERTTPFIEFLARAREVHGDKYQYLENSYKGCSGKVTVICEQHGEFYPTGTNHLKGTTCRKCVDEDKVMTQQSFLKKAKEVHGDKYGYNKTKTKGSRSVVTITCYIHGDFRQKVVNHIAGKGCAKCGLSARGWSKTNFQEACDKHNDGEGFLYILNCYNDTESFFKIGITSRCVKRRYDYNKLMPYEYEVVHLVKSEGEQVYLLEKEINKINQNHRYTPSIFFGGHLTECFTDISAVEKLLRKRGLV